MECFSDVSICSIGTEQASDSPSSLDSLAGLDEIVRRGVALAGLSASGPGGTGFGGAIAVRATGQVTSEVYR